MQLKNICDVFSGYAFKSFNTEKEGTPIIKIGNINDDGTIDLHNCQYSTEEPNKKYKSKNGDIYIALSGATTGKIGLMKSDNYYINQRVGIVRIKDLKVPVDYLLFFLQSKTQKILSDAAGAAQPNISPKDIAKYEISIPSEEKMISISKELNLISRTIVLKQNKLLSLDELIKSRFIEMFETIDLTEQRSNWKELGLVSKIYTGTTPSTKEPKNWDGDVLWITPAEMNQDTFYVYDTVRKITEIGRKSKSLDLMPVNTVLLSTRAPIGKVGIVGKPMACNQGFKNFECSSEINPVFLYTLLKNNTDYLNSLGSGTTFLEVSKSRISKMLIPVPSIELQNQFESYIKLIDKSKFVCYSKYFLWLNFTFVSSTIAYSNVVSILEWPNRCWTCSIGIPLSIAFVANVLLNLCGCTLSSPIFLPIFLSIISTPLISSLSYGFKRLTKRASLSSFLESKYCCKCIFVFASKYTFRCLLPLPKTIHSLFSKSISLISNLTSSPTLIPVDIRTSTIAKSRLLFIDCFINSIVSSEYTSFTTFPVFTLWILLHGLFEI